MQNPQRTPPSITSNVVKKSGFRPVKLIPILIIIIFATFILRNQFPQVDDFFRSILQPEQNAAILNCRKAALVQSETPDFARVIRWGEASRTQNGFLIDHLVIGEMNQDGGEQSVAITCHSKMNGDIVKLHRKPYIPGSLPEPPDLHHTD